MENAAACPGGCGCRSVAKVKCQAVLKENKYQTSQISPVCKRQKAHGEEEDWGGVFLMLSWVNLRAGAGTKCSLFHSK